MRQLFKRQTHHFVYSVPFIYSMNATLSVCQEKVFLPNVYKIDTRRLISYQPSARVVLRIIGPRLWQSRPSAARSVLRQQRAKIPQYNSSQRGQQIVYHMALGLNLFFFFNLLDFKNFKKLNDLSRLSKPICYNKFFM